MINIEKALEPSRSYQIRTSRIYNILGEETPYEWFKNQEHLPFSVHSEGYHSLYLEFLEEIYQLYLKTGCIYYWFNREGELKVGHHLYPTNNIKINKEKLRDIKIEQLLS